MFKFLLAIFIFSPLCWSRDYHGDENYGSKFLYHGLPSQTVDIEALDGTHLKGLVHLQPKKENAATFVLAHGLLADLHSWDQLAESLYREGYNVVRFNWRGHGGIGYRSKAPTTKDYRYDNIVAYDNPAVISFASKIAVQQSLGTTDKVVFMGHSLGTMTARLALSGVTKNGNKMEENEAFGKELRSKIHTLFSIGSPADLHPYINLPKPNFTGMIMADITNSLVYSLSKSHRPDEQPRFLKESVRKVLAATTNQVTAIPQIKNLIKGAVNVDNLDPKTAGTFLLNSGGGAHREILRDILYMVNGNYSSVTNPQLIYVNRPIPSDLNMVVLTATEDTIAKQSDILNDQRQQPNQDNIRVVQMKGYGHTEMIAGRTAVQGITRMAKGVVENGFSETFGPSNTYGTFSDKFYLINPKTIQCFMFYDRIKF